MWPKVATRLSVGNKQLLLKIPPRLTRTFSSQLQEAYAQDIKDVSKPPKKRTLKRFTSPFPKSFFVGKCDPEVLEYPEVLDNDDIDALKSDLKKTLEIFHSDVNSNLIDTTGKIPPEILRRLSEVGLFGLRLPREYGGKGYTETESAMISEVFGLDSSIYKFLIEQQNLSGKFISLYGTEEQKELYLRTLVKGNLNIAIAYLENANLSDTVSQVSTVALPGLSGGFEITGKKQMVYNATVADAFITFASHPKIDENGDRSTALSAFLIPKNSPGVTVHPPAAKHGLRGVDICQVDFLNVEVGLPNILGKPHDGLNMILSILGGKFCIAPSIVGITKAIVNDLTRYCIKADSMQQQVIEQEYIKAKLGRMMTAIYALESATYLQAGIADIYQEPDVFLETCILKVLASKTLQFVLREATQMLGTQTYIKPEFQYIDRLIRESHYHASCDETDFLLKMTISLHGLQHAGMTVHDEIRKIRNPLMYPMFILRKMLESRNRENGTGNLNLGLAGYLHPNLQHSAAVLEFCISRVQLGAETLLSRYGKEIIDKHLELESLAEIAIRTYTMVATLARASRSYCIGLRESESDMELALAYTNYAQRSIRRHYNDLSDGPVVNNTNRYLMISERMVANKGYFAESPIERNF